MTDISKYKNVSLKKDTYNKLKDLSAMNKTPVSKSGLISYLVDKEWNDAIKHCSTTVKPNLLTNSWNAIVSSFSRSSSEEKSNDN